MNLIYIIAPYSADTTSAIGANVMRASKAAALIIDQCEDFHPVCVHAESWNIVPHLRKLIPEERWRTAGIEKLRRCDCAIVIGDVSKSVGSQAEIEYCEMIGKPIARCLEPVDSLSIKMCLDDLRMMLADV